MSNYDLSHVDMNLDGKDRLSAEIRKGFLMISAYGGSIAIVKLWIAGQQGLLVVKPNHQPPWLPSH